MSRHSMAKGIEGLGGRIVAICEIETFDYNTVPLKLTIVTGIMTPSR